ncbi:MAG: hypothetical protein JWQ71_1750 [Pedosphaera sp.]|nr:hypothetical protein [Pedosphaera sp.]
MPTVVNCLEKDWKVELKTFLQEGFEPQLVNFDYTMEGPFCEMLALAHRMTLTIKHDKGHAFFKKPNIT